MAGVQLFSGKSFFILQRVPLRSSLIKDIERHGGRVVKLEQHADFLIGDHLRKDVPPGYLSYTFVEAAVKDDALPEEALHAIGHATAGMQLGTAVSPASRPAGSFGFSAPVKTTRTPFTAADDQVLQEFVARYAAAGGAVRGNEMYKELAAINPRHTFQSWRDRWVKVLSKRVTLPSPSIMGQSSSTAAGVPHPRTLAPSAALAPSTTTQVLVATAPTPSVSTQMPSSTLRPFKVPRSTARKRALPDSFYEEMAAPSPQRAWPASDYPHGFTEEDFETVLSEAHDIENIRRCDWQDAWDRWAAECPGHSAEQWESFYGSHVRPEYLRRQQAAKEAEPSPEVVQLDGAVDSAPDARPATATTARAVEAATPSPAPPPHTFMKKTAVSRPTQIQRPASPPTPPPRKPVSKPSTVPSKSSKKTTNDAATLSAHRPRTSAWSAPRPTTASRQDIRHNTIMSSDPPEPCQNDDQHESEAQDMRSSPPTLFVPLVKSSPIQTRAPAQPSQSGGQPKQEKPLPSTSRPAFPSSLPESLLSTQRTPLAVLSQTQPGSSLPAARQARTIVGNSQGSQKSTQSSQSLSLTAENLARVQQEHRLQTHHRAMDIVEDDEGDDQAAFADALVDMLPQQLGGRMSSAARPAEHHETQEIPDSEIQSQASSAFLASQLQNGKQASTLLGQSQESGHSLPSPVEEDMAEIPKSPAKALQPRTAALQDGDFRVPSVMTSSPPRRSFARSPELGQVTPIELGLSDAQGMSYAHLPSELSQQNEIEIYDDEAHAFDREEHDDHRIKTERDLPRLDEFLSVGDDSETFNRRQSDYLRHDDRPVSPIPSDSGEDVEAYINAKITTGFKERHVIAALEATCMEPTLADVALGFLSKRLGLPDGIAGIWSKIDDEDLGSEDPERLKMAEAKHGARNMEKRRVFLRDFDEA